MSTEEESHELPDHAGVLISPPLLLGGLVLAGFGLRAWMPLSFLPEGWPLKAGSALMTLVIALFIWAALTMIRGGSSLPTGQPTAAIVRTGPYRFTRNPIYLAMVLLFLALACGSNSAWFFALALVDGAFLHVGVILREERYLERKFGDAYLDYKESVRRWV